MNRYALLLLLLLPLTAANAQRLTDPKQLVPELSTLTQPSPSVYLDEFFPNVDEPSMFHGPVHSVTTTYEIPDTVTRYVGSHRIKVYLHDVMLSKTTNFTFSQQGKLSMIAEKYLMHSYFYYRKKYSPKDKYYFRHKKFDKISHPEVRMEEIPGEKRWRFKDGKLVSYSHVSSEKDDTLKRIRRKGRITYYLSGTHIGNDSVRLKYDRHGNLRTVNRFNSDMTRFRFAYDSLGRMVYMSQNDISYGLLYVYAWMYDSTGCAATVSDRLRESSDSVGEMRLLHKEPQPDGSLELRITCCEVMSDSDKSAYVALRKHPDSCLAPFFSRRLAHCEEKISESRNWWHGYENYYTTGEYIFDTAGRLKSYNLWTTHGIASTSVVNYDSAGRVVEMKAIGGTLYFPKSYYIIDRSLRVRSGVYRQILFSYDEEGQVSEIALTDQSGKKEVISIRHTYDSHHNWIRRETWRDGRQTGAVSREIEYAE